MKACYGSKKCDESNVEWQFPAKVWLNPASASCVVGEPHVLRATVNRFIDGTITPLVGKTVTFSVLSGPNAGTPLPSATTDATGDAFSQCTGNSTGTNEFEACIIDNGGVEVCSVSQAIWGASRHFLRSLT